MEFMKVELGLQGSLLTRDFELYGHLGEDIWVKHLWEFSNKSGIQVEDKLHDFQFVREDDSTLNEWFAAAFQLGKITKSEWSKANKCRLYLKVLTVGDIASGDGCFIDEGMRKGNLQLHRARALDWLTQHRPKRTDWYTWSRVLKQSLLNEQGKLVQPVGKWLHHVDTAYDKQWEW